MRIRPVAFFVVVILLALIYPFIATGTLAQGTMPAPDSVYLPIVIKPAPTATIVPTATPIAATATPTTIPGGDTDAPHLVTWSFAPSSVNVSSSDQVITFTAHFTDNLSGVIDFSTGMGGEPPQARFESPSGQQGRTVTFSHPEDLISGTAQNGIYRNRLVLLRFSETGAWKIDYFSMTDNVGNRRRLSLAEVAALGLPTSFFVQN